MSNANKDGSYVRGRRIGICQEFADVVAVSLLNGNKQKVLNGSYGVFLREAFQSL